MARAWTEKELLIAMNVYCKLPFGKLNHTNAFIVQVAKRMDRTASSVSMKLCNLASFDPALRARGVRGLRAASRADRDMWDAFVENWDEMSVRSEAAFEDLMHGATLPPLPGESLAPPAGPSENEATRKVRRHQAFFRNAVLSSYDYRCALTGLEIPALLNASHIIAWAECEARRADPTNGICLNALFDRAFDRKLITFDEDFRLVLSKTLRDKRLSDYTKKILVSMEGHRLQLPHRFLPDSEALAIHRSKVLAC